MFLVAYGILDADDWGVESGDDELLYGYGEHKGGHLASTASSVSKAKVRQKRWNEWDAKDRRWKHTYAEKKKHKNDTKKLYTQPFKFLSKQLVPVLRMKDPMS